MHFKGYLMQIQPKSSELYDFDSRIDKTNAWLILLLLGAATLIISFWGAFGLKRWGDDWTFVYWAFEAHQSGAAKHIFSRLSQHWSPLWHSVEVLNYAIAGWESDLFIRIVVIFFRILGLLALILLARYFKLGLLATAIAVVVFVLHHAIAATIFSIDAHAQCAADTLGWLGSFCFLRFSDESKSLKSRWYLFSLILLIVALLFKEQALAVAGIYVVFAVIRLWPQRKQRMFIRRLLFILAPILAVVLLFVVMRRISGIAFQLQGPYRIAPIYAPKNMAMILLALASPARTLEWFDAIRSDPVQIGRIFFFATATLVLSALVIAGFRFRHRTDKSEKNPNRYLLLMIAALAISCYPVSIMAHVGEVHVSTSLIWFALIIAWSAQGWVKALRSRSTLIRTAVSILLLLYLTALGAGQRANLQEMHATGERASIWLSRFREALKDIPAGSRVGIQNHNPDRGDFDYGLYRSTTARKLVLVGPDAPMYATNRRLIIDHRHQPPHSKKNTSPPSTSPGSRFYVLHIRGQEVELEPKQ